MLLESAVNELDIQPSGTYCDLTFGGGGHSRHILSKLGAEGRLYSFDQDRDTLANCPDDARFHYVASNFRFLRGAMRLRGVEQVDGVLADLGVSSHHFDAKHRGFSFRGEALLDMRMNTRGGRTAADIVNTYTNDALSRIFAEYGEFFNTECIWGGGKLVESSNLTIGTFTSLVSFLDPSNKKYNPKFFDSYDCVFVDETHRANAKSIKDILQQPFMKSTKLVFGMTGTLPKPYTIDSYALHTLLGAKIQTIKADDLIQQGYISPVKIYQHHLHYKQEDSKEAPQPSLFHRQEYLQL